MGSPLTLDCRVQIDSPGHCSVIPKSDPSQFLTTSAAVTWLFQRLLVGRSASQSCSLMSGVIFWGV